ncbi:GIY-YIG domain-containing protein [Streptococcus pneumoniae]|nr:GIY-YIG domain-containing protein [Streptococcus pneumoniae]
MDHKAYMYVLECRDGSYYIGYTTDMRRRLAIHNSGKGAKYTEHACQSNLSMLKVLPVRKKPCRLKLFSSVRRGHRRKNFYLKIKIEIYSVILKNRGESFDSSYLCQKAKKMLQ